ncbi:MAG: hypothetical protein IJB81_01885 [Clostridia bacterium]|nr:hypothetical protein [Clostridia bacterium]
MKKLLAALVCLAMLAMLCAFAETEPQTVYVSVSDGSGELVLAYQPVALTDADADGALTICDALSKAHAAWHPAGAAAFLAEESEWGLSLYRLWNEENGGSYYYYVNDVSPLSLLDTVKAGDHIKAYAFTDLMNFSDTYVFFAAPEVTSAVNTPVQLLLTANDYDENWMPITVPAAGAEITVNGEKTGVVTDENGMAMLTMAQAGEYVISAVSDQMTLVPPVCLLHVTE